MNKRGSLGWRRTTVLALGAITVLAVLSVDPAAAALLLDTDFLVLAGTAGLALAGADLRSLAHRLATIRNADRVLVFEEGRIAEAGGFDELVSKGGRFAALARAQFLDRDQPRKPADAGIVPG